MVPGGKRTNKGVGKIMKTAIVYYSMSGNTKYVADKIAEGIKASGEVDIIRIKPEKAYPDKGAKKFFGVVKVLLWVKHRHYSHTNLI